MEDDELALPSLSKTLSDPQLPLNILVQPLKSRKRPARSYDLLVDDDAYASSLHTSSDPALFSSDETPDAENYSGGKRRKKKTYAGTWWGERHGKPGSFSSSSSRGRRTTRRKFTRNVDSGVFMCSDDGSTDFSSDSSLGAELMADQRKDEELSTRAFLRTPPPPSRASKLSMSFTSASPQSPRIVKKPTVTDPKIQRVRDAVRRAVDEGIEIIDLCDMQLDSLPPEVREITTMVKKGPSVLTHGDPFTAEPRLLLSNNLFRQFPSPLLDLSNLRQLSLRQNKLTHIPSGIRNLTQLQTLNISGNRLVSLPIAILDLITNYNLLQLYCDPNSWLKRPEDYKQPNVKNPRHQRVSACARYYTLTSSDILPETTMWHTPLTLVASNEKVVDDAKATVPSLSEIVLRQLSLHNPSKRDLSAMMPDDSPPDVTKNLQELYRAQNEGGRHCAYCERELIIPSRQWIEWWDIMGVGADMRCDHVRNGDYDTLKKELQPAPSLILPFEVGVCGGCE